MSVGIRSLTNDRADRLRKAVDDPNENWIINGQVFEAAIDFIIDSGVTVNRSYDIPYTAGYNVDGSVIYIDRMMPKGFKFGGKTYLTDRHLVVHEYVEKTFLLRVPNDSYIFAHQFGLRAEHDSVIADDLDWDLYNDRFMLPNVTKIGSREQYSQLPDDLDLKPYIDEKDADVFKRIGLEGISFNGQFADNGHVTIKMLRRQLETREN